ncbi:MAG: RNA methyltransferase [Lewinellaceae bacterium]|nr:RNA methyltransferase [Lewinellaceae bacterium]
MPSIDLPLAFAARMAQTLGESEWSAFQEALSLPSPTSIRRHFLKNLTLKENYDGVKWYTSGVYLNERPSFTLDPLLHAGAYYVQEASSMLIGEAFRQCFPKQEGLRVLDLAAAPGGKSTLLAELLPANSFLIANEVIRGRYPILQHNLARWGYPAVASSNHDSQDFGKVGPAFDLVLLDAPCSGEGLFRKDPAATQEWSEEAVQVCAARQRRILTEAAQCVAPGGWLFYSTCTYNAQENDDNVRWIAEESGLTLRSLDFPADWGIITSPNGGYQCYPHRVRGEGFYLAVLQKPGIREESTAPAATSTRGWGKWRPMTRAERELASPWLSEPEAFTWWQNDQGYIRALPVEVSDAFVQWGQRLWRFDPGVLVGQWKGKDLVPAPELALSLAVSPHIPVVSLEKQEALRYLKKEIPQLEVLPKGWALVQYAGLNLGWIKGIGSRVNNYFPREWRILMDIG